MPRVSVVMPMYNPGVFLQPALDSVLAQTFTDYEFIIIDDGSTDQSATIVDHIRDARIRLVRQKNQGIAATLNRGIELATGQYVARQDADDVSLPERFARQVEYLDRHPELAVLGTGALLIDSREHAFSRFLPFTSHARLVAELRRGICPIIHGAVMARTDALRSVGGYLPVFDHIQDVELWLRMSSRFQLANLREILYQLRKHDRSITQQAHMDLKIKAFARTGRLSPRTDPREWLEFIDEFDRNFEGTWRARAFEAENRLRRAQMSLARGQVWAAIRDISAAIRLSPETIRELPGRALRRAWRTLTS